MKLNRMEVAGSLGDLGTLLPIAFGMILINGLDPLGVFLSAGLFYILSGIYFGVVMPVQPMKVIGAYAIATGIDASDIMAATILTALSLLIIGGTGAIRVIGQYTPRSVVRGVQLSTGALLMAHGVKFIIGTSTFQNLHQAAEPFLVLQSLGPVPVGLIIGVLGGLLTLFLIENRKLPAGLIVVLGGVGLGLILGRNVGLSALDPGIYLPKVIPFGLPKETAITFALLALVLPQLPMTVGNAVIANADLAQEYFGEMTQRVTYRALCISMALANCLSFLMGGMPLCHGAGGLAAHYRFGARTAGSNLIIGSVFVLSALLLGPHVLSILYLLPMSVLGILLLYSGSQLAITVLDVDTRKDLFVVLVMLGITLASNLAAAFVVGLAISHILKWHRLQV